MIKYILEIEIDENGVSVHEKTDEGLTPFQARIIMSILEEYKVRVLNYILFTTKPEDLKGRKKND